MPADRKSVQDRIGSVALPTDKIDHTCICQKGIISIMSGNPQGFWLTKGWERCIHWNHMPEGI
ncbi:hypothetical protein AT798_00190 [Megasphaera sp. DJF_B143]|nr:hypothetical protein AT798_00190 [Megasphaera sp. DJF_B143]